MSVVPPSESNDSYENALRNQANNRYILRLYVAGNTPRSKTAIENILKVCEERLEGRYQLEVIDIYQQPELAREQQIIATPTLIRALPLPLRKMIGDLSKEDRLLVGLDLVQDNHKE